MISRSQLFCILLLSRLSAEIVFPYSSDFSGTGLVALLVSEGVRFLLALPILIYSLGGRDFYGAILHKSKALGVASGLIAALIIAMFFARTVLYTAEFAQRTLLGGMSGAVLLAILLIFAVYAAKNGAEGICRAGVLVLITAAIVTATVMLADNPHIRLRSAVGADFGESFVRSLIVRFMCGGEYPVLAVLLPYVRPKNENSHGIGGTGFLFVLCSIVGTVLINLFSMGVLGEFYAIAEYPLIASAQLSDIALFKRLDGFAGAVWALAAAVRGGLLLFSTYAVIRAVLPQKRKAGETV